MRTQNSKSRKNQPGARVSRQAPISIAKLPRWVFAVFGIVGFLWMIGAIFPSLRTWGFSHAAYLSVPWTAFLFAACLAMLLPATRETLARILAGAEKGLASRSHETRILLGIAAALCAGLLMFLFTIPASLLGDSYLYTSELARIVGGKPIRYLSYHSLIGPLVFFRFGSVLIHTFRMHESYAAFTILTAGFGSAYIGALLFYTRRAARDASDAVFFAALLFGCASTLFFFGYVEFYAPLTLAVTCFVLTLHAALARGASLAPPTVWLFIALACHFVGIAMIPALLWAHARRRFDARNIHIRGKTFFLFVAAASGLCILVYALSAVFGILDLHRALGLIPFRPTLEQGYYTMFSAAHLADLPNIVLLTGGMAPVLVGVLATGAAGRIHWESAAVQAAALLAFFFFLVAVFFHPLLGMARDWDIFAPLGVAVAGLAFAMYDSIEIPREHRATPRLALSGLALIGVIAWIALNAGEAASIARFSDLLEHDEGIVHADFTEYGYQNLAKHYSRKNDAQGRVHALRRAVETRGYPWDVQSFTAALAAIPDSRPVKADIEAVTGLLLRKTTDSLAMNTAQDAAPNDSTEYVADLLVRLYMNGADAVLTPSRIASIASRDSVLPQAAVLRLLRGRSTPPDRLAVMRVVEAYEHRRYAAKPMLSVYLRCFLYSNIATLHMMQSQADSACVWYQRCYALDSSVVPMINAYARARALLGDGSRAMLLLARARALDPDDAETCYTAAECLLSVFRDTVATRRELKACLSRPADPRLRSRAMQLLRRVESP